MGISFFNLAFYSSEQIWHNPALLLNVQKGFYVTEQWKVGIGSQSGFSQPLHENTANFVSFNYWNNSLDLHEWGKYYLGVYYANQAFANGGGNVNLLAGVEFCLLQMMSILWRILLMEITLSVGLLLVWFGMQPLNGSFH
jgi:hypothetical protein